MRILTRKSNSYCIINHARRVSGISRRSGCRFLATRVQFSMEELRNSSNDIKSEPLKPLKPLKPPKSGSSNTGMTIKYIKSMMDKHPDSVVLAQVGSFYEIYLHQAVEFGPKLNLKIARKSQASPFPGIPFINMAGFPCYQLDRYLKTLVNELNMPVLLLEQNPSLDSAMSEEDKRPISRIVTPGTLVGDSFLDSTTSNYLAAIEFTNHHLDSPPDESSPVSIAWVDLSVGSFYFQATTLGELIGDLSRIRPKEILLDSNIKKYGIHEGRWFDELIELNRYFFTYKEFPLKEDFKYYTDLFEDSSSVISYIADHVGEKELSAMTAITHYIKENLPGTNVKLELPIEQFSKNFIRMDSRSQAALELFQSTTRDSTRGSLLSIIRRTVTPSGSRLLNDWLSYPLVDIKSIEKRQDLVSFFLKNPILSNDLVEIFRTSDDCQRTLQRLKLKRFDPLDLHIIASCIQQMKSTLNRLKTERKLPEILQCWVRQLETDIHSLNRLSLKILKSLDMNAIIAKRRNEEELLANNSMKSQKRVSVKKDGTETKAILHPNSSTRLEKLYESRNEFDDKKTELETKLSAQCDEKQLPIKVKLRWSPMLLYHVFVKLDSRGESSIAKYVNDIDIPGAIVNQTKKTVCIQNIDWTSLGVIKDKFQQNVQDEEERIIDDFKNKVVALSKQLNQCSVILDNLDVLISFAKLAKELNLVKPILDDSTDIEISNGSHITVSSSLARQGVQFTENNCNLGVYETSRISIITGPNMGGKSTYLRQIALICILAQTGCFVPAKYARLGVVDRIFCRVGAGDDLYRGRSTFMVEMLETGNILKHATNRSLAILDEVGRGTSTKDGLRLAYATLRYLHDENKCRTLFATHFGREIWDILAVNDAETDFNYYHTDVLVKGSSVVFDHKMKHGICSDSHGLKVAELAGFPSEALRIAEYVKGYGLKGMKGMKIEKTSGVVSGDNHEMLAADGHEPSVSNGDRSSTSNRYKRTSNRGTLNSNRARAIDFRS